MTKLYAYLIAVAAVLALVWGYGHVRFQAGEKKVQAKWNAAIKLADEDFAKREALILADRNRLSNELAFNQAALEGLQKRLKEASTTKTLTRTVTVEIPVNAPCTCPVLDSGFTGLWNDAGQGAGSTTPR